MKVLFVYSANANGVNNPIIKNQGDSLSSLKEPVCVDYYPIVGSGIKGYISNLVPLRRMLKKNYDVVHAHYSLSALLTSLAGARPLVVSLMGSDVKSSNGRLILTRLFAFFFSWKSIIVKSNDMKISLGIRNAKVIPNGVNTNRFRPISQCQCCEKLGWDISYKHILFASNPARLEKNYNLAKEAIRALDDARVKVHYLMNVSNEDAPYLYNAADVVLLTSLWEGSPNAIKEALSCCRPIVATKVGDVEDLIRGVSGCFLTTFSAEDCSSQISKALNFSKNYHFTNGRDKILKMRLDSNSIAERIVEIYKSVL